MERRRTFTNKHRVCGVGILTVDIALCVFMLTSNSRLLQSSSETSKLGWEVDCGQFEHAQGIVKYDSHCMSTSSSSHANILSEIVDTEMKQHTEKTSKADDVLIDANPHGLLKGLNMSAGNYVDTNLLQTIETWSPPRYGISGLYFGVRLRHGRLVVPTSGLYHIFSHIDFTEMNDYAGQDAPKLEHRMYKFNILQEGKSEVEILQAGLTPCLTNTKWQNEENAGSYAGATTHLQAGDEISVRVTHIHLLRANQGQHYFGLHRLSQ